MECSLLLWVVMTAKSTWSILSTRSLGIRGWAWGWTSSFSPPALPWCPSLQLCLVWPSPTQMVESQGPKLLWAAATGPHEMTVCKTSHLGPQGSPVPPLQFGRTNTAPAGSPLSEQCRKHVRCCCGSRHVPACLQGGRRCWAVCERRVLSTVTDCCHRFPKHCLFSPQPVLPELLLPLWFLLIPQEGQARSSFTYNLSRRISFFFFFLLSLRLSNFPTPWAAASPGGFCSAGIQASNGSEIGRMVVSRRQ